MSLRLFTDDVLFLQRLLKAQGLYGAGLDGIWGPVTEAGATRFQALSLQIRERHRTFDLRSEAQISTLLLTAQAKARAFLARVLDAGIIARIISGTRRYEEQNRLFRRGRYGNAGPVVTNARGGQSLHNFGLAWDIGVFGTDGSYLTVPEPYERAAEAGLVEGLEWGGHNPRFVDRPHFHLETGLGVAELRARFEAGVAYAPAAEAVDAP